MVDRYFRQRGDSGGKWSTLDSPLMWEGASLLGLTQSSSIAMEHTYLLKMMESSLLYSDCRILQVCIVPVMFGVLDFIDSDG